MFIGYDTAMHADTDQPKLFPTHWNMLFQMMRRGDKIELKKRPDN